MEWILKSVNLGTGSTPEAVFFLDPTAPPPWRKERKTFLWLWNELVFFHNWSISQPLHCQTKGIDMALKSSCSSKTKSGPTGRNIVKPGQTLSVLCQQQNPLCLFLLLSHAQSFLPPHPSSRCAIVVRLFLSLKKRKSVGRVVRSVGGKQIDRWRWRQKKWRLMGRRKSRVHSPRVGAFERPARPRRQAGCCFNW